MTELPWIVRRLQDLAYHLARAAAVIAGVLLLYMIGHVLLDIVLRAFFNASTFVVTEFVGYAVAAMTFLALAYALEEGALIRVNIVLYRLAGRSRRVLELFCAGATALLMGFLTWHMWLDVARAFERGSTGTGIIAVPQWIPTGAVTVGAGLLTLQLVVRFLRLAFGGPIDIHQVGGVTASEPTAWSTPTTRREQ